MHIASRDFAGRYAARKRLEFVAFISIERAVENLVDYPGSDGHQYQVSASLPPLVAIVMRKPAEQSAIEFFGDRYRDYLRGSQWRIRLI